MMLSNFSLDMIATELSKFQDPNIPELTLRDSKTLQNNMLESVLGIFSGHGNTYVRHLMTNIVRKIFASMEFYHAARMHAIEYVSGNRHSNVTPYFRSLNYFEVCVSYTWQTVDLFVKASGAPVFTQGDGSAWERLHSLYTYGTKHSLQKYDTESRPEMPTAVWLRDKEIVCLSGHSVTYQELTEAITANNDMFYSIQAAAHARRASAREPHNEP